MDKQYDTATWLPDIINESNGIACGDRLVLKAYRDNDKLFFSYSGDSCSIAKKVAEFLTEKLSGKYESFIKHTITRIKKGEFGKYEKWMNDLISIRKDCVSAPINLLEGIIDNDNKCNIERQGNTLLACDACVATKTLNWKPKRVNNANVNYKNILNSVKKMDKLEEIELQKFGLCILSYEKQKEFQEKLEYITVDYFKLIKKLRLASLLLNNANKYHLKIDPRIEELAVKQMISLAVANEEIDIVNQYIKNQKISIQAVKGGKINCYYPKEAVRTHMDFDYLAKDFSDAFKLIAYLINQRNFKLVIEGSVPFSLKCVRDINGKEVITGHIHLEKILQNKYQAIVDINIGGFPLGRTGIIQYTKNIEIEDLICITVAHIFKHECVFMKDINDLYYIFKNENIDYKKLLSKIYQYNLFNLFCVVYDFLSKNMNLNDVLGIKYKCIISEKRRKNWPFSRKSNFYIKSIDMMEFNKKIYGKQIGIKETISQICDLDGVINSAEYSILFQKINERVYLYPIVIFNKYQEKIESELFVKINYTMMVYHQILILPIGLFLIQNYTGDILDRKLLIKDIEFILSTIELSELDCNMSYIMESRRDTWLY